MESSIKILSVAVAIYFLTSNLYGVFLPIYFRENGLSLLEIIEVLLFTFLVIGLLPCLLLRLTRKFEAIITLGIFTTMIFNLVLIFIKNPIVLGFLYGLSIATFWPSFNLLQFRLSRVETRARTISFLSSTIPSVTGIIGPAIGGFIIEKFGFIALFASSIMLYIVAFLLSINIKFEYETLQFEIPKAKIFRVFFATFVIIGVLESYWLAYPFFVSRVSGTILNMGIVYALSGILIAIATFFVNWLSDIRGTRVEFAIIGAIFYAIWYFAIAYASTMLEIVLLSAFSGLASAFMLSWFAHYADSFPREYYASILVLMEVGLMIGRIINLPPTYFLIGENNYATYFILLGIVSLFLIPLYVVAKPLQQQ